MYLPLSSIDDKIRPPSLFQPRVENKFRPHLFSQPPTYKKSRPLTSILTIRSLPIKECRGRSYSKQGFMSGFISDKFFCFLLCSFRLLF